MDSVPGQTFLNYAYSWGASIVILGTLFKLTHLPGANFFLFLGMGTEVFVFFISAFDRPFDKTADGMELDVHPGTTGATVVGNIGSAGGVIEGGVIEGSTEGSAESSVEGGNGGTVVIGGGGGGGTVIIGGGGTTGSGSIVAGGGPIVAGGAPIIGGAPMPSVDEAPVVDTEAIAAVSSSVVTMSGGTGVIGGPVGGSVPPINPELEEATTNYVDELKRLTEMLARVSAQSERLAHDSEEMENLNRTLTGITKVYEMQLKSASSQIGTIDEINEQTKKMAAQILELNKIYARMIEAMTAKLNV